MRVVELGQHALLAEEAFARAGVDPSMANGLYGDAAVELLLDRLINLAHAARSNPPQDEELAEPPRHGGILTVGRRDQQPLHGGQRMEFLGQRWIAARVVFEYRVAVAVQVGDELGQDDFIGLRPGVDFDGWFRYGTARLRTTATGRSDAAPSPIGGVDDLANGPPTPPCRPKTKVHWNRRS